MSKSTSMSFPRGVPRGFNPLPKDTAGERDIVLEMDTKLETHLNTAHQNYDDCNCDWGPLGRIPQVPESEWPSPGVLAARLILKVCLSRTEAMYVCRTALHESHTDTIMDEVKSLVKRSAKESQVRRWVGGSKDVWYDFKLCLWEGIAALKGEVFVAPSQENQGINPTTHMCARPALLSKDLERLWDLMILARNLLVSNPTAQHYAVDTGTDQLVLQIFEVCIRVCARSNDSDPGGPLEKHVGQIVSQHKQLLVACLQFLHNLTVRNERCMLSLWLDLFAHRIEWGLGLSFGRYCARNVEVPKSDELGIPVGTQNDHRYPNFDSCLRIVCGMLDHRCKAEFSPEETVLVKKIARDLALCLKDVALKSTSQNVNPEDLKRTGRDPTPGTYREHCPAAYDIAVLPPSFISLMDANITHVDMSEEYIPIRHRQYYHKIAKRNLVDDLPMDFPELSDDISDVGYERTPTDPQQAAEARAVPELAVMNSTHPVPHTKTETGAEDPLSGLGLYPMPETGFGGEDEEGEEDDADDDERDPHGMSYKQRGILAELPLVLGPSEIEALPMIIQSGIWTHIEANEVSTFERLMKAIRCHLLLTRAPGRHILRELLIFIAAWDLQDEDIFFQLMVNIMESVLYHGLMPRAYQSFSEPKDIVSPAQSILIKMLTHIFRRKRNKGPPYNPADSDTLQHLPDQFRFDKQIIGVLIDSFRMSVVPETVALIWLQGKIRADIALPEDFPMHLWDMERVYEGVYQFLEFFAVLTETAVWKEMLVKHELSFELIALLRELDNCIPKKELNIVAEQSNHAQEVPGSSGTDPAAPSPVELPVERPYDTGSAGPGAEPLVSPPASPGQEALEEGQEACEFEWRNLKKLVVLVLSSLTWKSVAVKTQIRNLGGVELVMNCCNYDASNPYIREHAVLCLKFLLEDCVENQEIVAAAEGKFPR